MGFTLCLSLGLSPQTQKLPVLLIAPTVRLSAAPRQQGIRLGFSPWVRSLPVLLAVLSIFCCAARGISQLCFEKISDTVGLYLQQHPATRKWAVVASQRGNLTLFTLPGMGRGRRMRELATYLDLTSRVRVGEETGLLSFAFHPRFVRNGRFFASYSCDASRHPDCQALCGCSPSVGCRVGVGKQGVPPPGCTLTTIVAEFRALPRPRAATRLNPTEVRRTISFARPYVNHNGGHVFFGKDSYLYLTSGDGGNQGDPWKLAQNPRSHFGKILRLNVDKVTNSTNFTIPTDNPLQGMEGLNPLVYALGLRNPWRCDQDPASGTLVCGDVGGDQVEEINIIRKGGNYEWRNFEGSEHRTGISNTSLFFGAASGPLFSYTHDDLGGLGCVIGGVFYSNPINRCLLGKYLYADHSGPIWVATVLGTPTTTRVRFTCSPTSPLPCPKGGDGSDQEWGEIYSWSKDLRGNAYLLTSTGIYRVANQSGCGIEC